MLGQELAGFSATQIWLLEVVMMLTLMRLI